MKSAFFIHLSFSSCLLSKFFHESYKKIVTISITYYNILCFKEIDYNNILCFCLFFKYSPVNNI